MKRKVAVYWPAALIVPLAVLAWAHAWHDVAAQTPPLASEQVGAELARTMSFGMVGNDAQPVRASEPAVTAARAI